MHIIKMPTLINRAWFRRFYRSEGRKHVPFTTLNGGQDQIKKKFFFSLSNHPLSLKNMGFPQISRITSLTASRSTWSRAMAV